MERNRNYREIFAPARTLASVAAVAASLIAIAPALAVANAIPWRAGMSRTIGLGRCAKGPCLRRHDFSPSAPHVHIRVNGLMTTLLCDGPRPDRACRNR